VINWVRRTARGAERDRAGEGGRVRNISGDRMADDPIQRTYRASQPPVRQPSDAAPPSSSDPLAELARLIGQNDPFGEYGSGRSAADQPAVRPDYVQAPASNVHANTAPDYADERYSGMATYGDGQYPPKPAPAAAFSQPPAPQQYAHDDYADPAYAGGAYAQAEEGLYDPIAALSGTEEEHFYDDAPPRRRMGILIVAAVFTLGVIGAAGVFGYRALFGSSAPSAPPPVIKANTTPSKIVPSADSKDPKSGKLIYDRVNNNAQNEKIVSREEQPIDIKDKPVNTVLPQDQSAPDGSMQRAALGTGVIGVEPKKIHTIAIHPDQVADGASASPPPASSAPASIPAPEPTKAPMHAEPSAPAKPAHLAAEPRPRPVAHEKAPAQQTAAPSNAPLSLSPNASTPARSIQRSVRTAAVGTPARVAPAREVARTTHAAPTRIAPAASSGGGYAVQVASRHNESDAKVSFHSLQAKYPKQLGGRQLLIRRVDLGAKGIYYRAMVGPLGSAEEARKLCSSLKAAGANCLVQKI
jgi:hypothetical protein